MIWEVDIAHRNTQVDDPGLCDPEVGATQQHYTRSSVLQMRTFSTFDECVPAALSRDSLTFR